MEKKQIKFLRSEVSKSNPQCKKDTDAFIKEMDIETIPFEGEVFFISSGGTEEEFKQIYSKSKAPYTIIAMDSNNSLPAALEIASFLRSKKLSYNLYHGTPSEVREELLTNHQHNIIFNLNLKPEIKVLENERLGVIGEPSPWLIASSVNYQKAKEVFGVELVDIPFDVFQKYINQATPLEFAKYKKLINEKISEEELKKALKIYSALSKIVKDYNLKGLTVRCFDLLDTAHSTSCLGLAILNSKKITSACEGDIPALLSMHIINKVFKKVSFQCNPSYLNQEENYAYLAHCTLPLNMCKEYSLDTHFESGIGVAIKGELDKKAVTIFKLNSDLTKFSVFAGKIVDSLYKNNLCRTQIKVQFNEPVDNLLTSPCGNHLIVAYGNFEYDLVKLLALD